MSTMVRKREGLLQGLKKSVVKHLDRFSYYVASILGLLSILLHTVAENLVP